MSEEENPYTRRDKWKLTPEILSQYHALIMNNDVAGFEKLLAQYAPFMDDQTRRERVEAFTQHAATILRHRWRPSK